MEKRQAQTAADFLKTVLPARTDVRIFTHGERTPGGYFISVLEGQAQRILHTPESVADFLSAHVKLDTGNGNGGATKTATNGTATGRTLNGTAPSAGTDGNGAGVRHG